MTRKNAIRYSDLSQSTRRKLANAALDPRFTKIYTDELQVDHLFSTRASAGNDVAQVHITGCNAVLVTHAASMAEENGEPVHTPPAYWYSELSHTCGLPFCLSHFAWELPWENIERDGCHKYNHFPECPHDPPCLEQPNLARAKKALHRGVLKRKAEEDALLAEKELAKTMKKRRYGAQYYQIHKDRLKPKNNAANKERRRRRKDDVVVHSD